MSLTQKIAALQDYKSYAELNWTGTFEEYLELVRKNPKVTRTAYQRMYDMILSYGQEEYIDNKKRLIRYNFFKDEHHGGKDAVFGLDIPLMRLVNVFKSAAHRYGTEKRVILLHGPVGSSKSTIARLLKRGAEEYSRTPEGALYTYEWVLPPELRHISGGAEVFPSPMHEEPLRIIPAEWRQKAFKELGLGTPEFQMYVEGDLNPACRLIFRELMTHYAGDWQKVVQHVRVKRMLLSEKDRIGIGTFQPKDEKNQDSTELTGDINYRKIAEYGSDSDPRAFNFDGEFNIANRGIVEFIEVLKLDVAFLYDLLGASQEHKVKPKKFAQTDIDEVIIGHTNEAEYKKLLNNEFMEALRDRTIKIDIPYITRLSEETKIYKKDFNIERIKGKHIAPHTLEVAAMWAVLTRLEDPKKHNLSLLQKLKLYDGKVLPGYTQDTVKELRKESKREGMEGISPRYVQDKISNALVNDAGETNRESLTINRSDFWASTSNKQLNFVQHIFTILKQHGRAAVVVPDNVLFEGGAGETVRRELLKNADVHTLLRLPTGIFYAQGVKANVVFFERKPAQETPWTKKLWIYDLRTNKHFTLKENTLKRSDLDDFVSCYHQKDRNLRKESERFKCFDYDDLVKRDKLNLDIFWLKDEALEESANLPPPEVIAADIAADLEAALEHFATIAEDLK